MKIKVPFLIIIVACSVNYNLYSQKKSIDTITFSTVFMGNPNKNTSAYQSNDFVVNAFSKGYKIKLLIKYFKKDFKLTKQPIPNLHDTSIIDTIYHFVNKKNEISVYKAIHAEFVNVFEVTDKRFCLKGNIHNGISKEDFYKKFRIKELKQDIVVISDEENMMKFYFTFKKNILSKISFKAFID